MSDQFTVNTPESAAFELEPAGLGSRFLATLIDMLIQIVLVAILLYSFTWVESLPFSLGGFEDVVGGTYLLLFGLVLGLYHLIFEAIWSGRSPGKRLVGLRVVKTTGVPIGFWDACLRNLIRLVDYLPFAYFAGIVTMFVSSQPRRLGDYAAGTLVVREQRHAVPRLPAEAPSVHDLSVAPAQHRPEAAVIGYREEELIGEFLVRRHSLEPSARADIARQLADRLHEAGITPAMFGLPSYTSDEDLLISWHQTRQRQ